MTRSPVVALSAMSAEPVSAPTRRTDDDVLARLATIDHRLLQISTRLAAVDHLLSQVNEIRVNLQTLIGPLGSAGLIMPGAACGLPDLKLHPSSAAAGGRSIAAASSHLAEEVHALAALLAEVVELTASRAAFPGRWAQIAEQAMEHGYVRSAVCALIGRRQGPDVPPRNGDGR
jgi:hypothetical protein